MWKAEPCDNPDCDESEHLFPEVGTLVRVVEAVTAREVGGEAEYPIPAGAEGQVCGYVIDWHDVDVSLDRHPRVWIDPSNLASA